MKNLTTILSLSLILISCVLDKARDNPRDPAGVAFTGTATQSQPAGVSSPGISSVPGVSSSSLTVQLITFEPIAQKTLGNADFAVSVGSTSNLPVTVSSATPNVCTVMGTIVHLVATGSCQLIASQAGDGTFAPATNVSQSFVIADPSKKDQNIVFGALADKIIGESFTLSANSTSGLSVSFGSVTPSTCSVNNTTVSTNAAGICTISAAQGGDPTWNAAQTVTQNFTIKKKPQSITFNSISSQMVGTGSIPLNAVTSSGAEVYFDSQTPSICTIAGNSVNLISSGQCQIYAYGAEDDTYEAPPIAYQSFYIYPANVSSSVSSIIAMSSSISSSVSSSSSSVVGTNLVIDAATFSEWGVDGGASFNDASGKHLAYFVPDADALYGGHSAVLAPDGSLVGPCPKDDATCVANWNIAKTQGSGISVASKLKVTSFVPSSGSYLGWGLAGWWLIPSVNPSLSAADAFGKAGPFGLDKNGTMVFDWSYTAGKPLTIQFKGAGIDENDANQASPRYTYLGTGSREKVSIKVTQVKRASWSIPSTYDPSGITGIGLLRLVAAGTQGAPFPTSEPVTTDFEFWSATLPITYGSVEQVPLPK